MRVCVCVRARAKLQVHPGKNEATELTVAGVGLDASVALPQNTSLRSFNGPTLHCRCNQGRSMEALN